MRTIELASASKPLSSYASKLRRGIVVFTEGRRPVAALVSLRGVDAETLRLSAHPQFLAVIGRARRQIAKGRTISLAEMKRIMLPKPPRKRVATR